MAEPTTVGIVHASPLIREGVRGLLSHHADMRVVGTFRDAREVLAQPIEADHILLYDLGTARQDGAALMMELHHRLPRSKILIFNVIDDDQAIIECVRVGASGCVLQDASLEDLLAAIRSVALGTPYTSPRVITSLFAYVAGLQAGDDRPPPTGLTKRESRSSSCSLKG